MLAIQFALQTSNIMSELAGNAKLRPYHRSTKPEVILTFQQNLQKILGHINL